MSASLSATVESKKTLRPSEARVDKSGIAEGSPCLPWRKQDGTRAGLHASRLDAVRAGIRGHLSGDGSPVSACPQGGHSTERSNSTTPSPTPSFSAAPTPSNPPSTFSPTSAAPLLPDLVHEPDPHSAMQSIDAPCPSYDLSANRAVRRRAYALRRGHRQLVMDHHKALGLCGLGTFGFKGEEKPMAHLVCDHGEVKGTLRRTSRCNSSWACPVCSARRAASRTLALLPQVRAHMAAGGTCHLLTLTMAHDRTMPLGAGLDVLTRAWADVTAGGAWTRACKEAVQWVRGQDVTHGLRHGWHPHAHILLLLGQVHGDGGAMAASMLARWQEMVQALGYRVSPDAQDHQRVDDPAKAAAYAVSPAAVYEPTAMAMKRARKNTGSRTPFEILEGAVGGSKADAALWVEYVRTVKGRRQVSCSRGLKLEMDDLCPPELDMDDEDADAAADIVAGIGREAVAELDREGLTTPLLDLVEDHAGDFDGVREAVHAFLGRLDSRDWRMFGRFEGLEQMEDAREVARDMAEAARLRSMGKLRTRPDAIDRRAMAIPDKPPPRNPYAPMPGKHTSMV